MRRKSAVVVTFRPCPCCGLELSWVDWGPKGGAHFIDDACLTLHECPGCEHLLPNERAHG